MSACVFLCNSAQWAAPEHPKLWSVLDFHVVVAVVCFQGSVCEVVVNVNFERLSDHVANIVVRQVSIAVLCKYTHSKPMELNAKQCITHA